MYDLTLLCNFYTTGWHHWDSIPIYEENMGGISSLEFFSYLFIYTTYNSYYLYQDNLILIKEIC